MNDGNQNNVKAANVKDGRDIVLKETRNDNGEREYIQAVDNLNIRTYNYKN